MLPAAVMQHLRNSVLPSHFKAENGNRKILFSHWVPLLASKREGTAINQRHFHFTSFLFFCFPVKSMAVEFWNSLVSAKPFFPSAAHLTSETSILTCLCPFQKGRQPHFLCRAGAVTAVSCCHPSLLSRGGITPNNVLWSCGWVLLLTSASRCRGGWHCLQKWAWTFRTLEESWVSHQIWIRFFF